MIARDEAHNLVRSIPAVTPFVTQVVVVDTGSKDATVETARGLGATVSSFPWNDSFADAKNHAIEQASEPFVLVVDADEVLAPGSELALAEFCRRKDGAAGRVSIRSELDASSGSVSVEHIVRIFPSAAGYRYRGRIHEQLLRAGKPPLSVSTGITLLHSGYGAAAVKQTGKIERNLHLLQLELRETPEDPYLHYQMGKTLYLAERYGEATAHLLRAVELIGAEETEVPSYAPNLFLKLAYASLRAGEPRTFLEVLAAACGLFPDFTDLYFAYGVGLMEMQDASAMDSIREAFEHCLALGETSRDRYETVEGVGTYRAHFNLGLYHELTGDLQAARDHYQAALDMGFQPASERLRAAGAT